MALDWKAIETKLATAAAKNIAAFGKRNAKLTFFGGMFVIEPFDGVFVKLVLDTPEHAATRDAAPHVRWMPSSFPHRIEITDSVPGWSKIDAAIVAATEADMANDATDKDGRWKTTAALIDTVCRVALRLEQDRAFAPLVRTPDFALAVHADQYEPGDLSLARLAKFRKAVAKQRPAKPTAKPRPAKRKL